MRLLATALGLALALVMGRPEGTEARLPGGGPERLRESDEGIVLELPPRDSATVDRIVRLTLARRPPGG